MSTISPSASFPDHSLSKLTIREGRHLPQWEASGAIYHIALHLADSVPREQLELWKAERSRLSALSKAEGRPLSQDETEQLKAVYDKRVEKYLSAGHGACLLRTSAAAEAVAKVILHSNGAKYALHEWCVMPNHLHIIVGGFDESHPLREILETWKRVSAHLVNAVLSRNGEVWHRDAYTRIIRNRQEYAHQMNYVWNNPEVAGLKDGFLRERYTMG